MSAKHIGRKFSFADVVWLSNPTFGISYLIQWSINKKSWDFFYCVFCEAEKKIEICHNLLGEYDAKEVWYICREHGRNEERNFICKVCDYVFNFLTLIIIIRQHIIHLNVRKFWKTLETLTICFLLKNVEKKQKTSNRENWMHFFVSVDL